MKNRTCRVSVPSVFASLFMLLALAVAFPRPASAQLAAPNHLRVDISDGTTGQLFVSWDQVSTATYYELQRSTSPSSGYADVANCSVAADAKNLDTPWVSKVCRDNNGGNPNPPPRGHPLLLSGPGVQLHAVHGHLYHSSAQQYPRDLQLQPGFNIVSDSAHARPPPTRNNPRTAYQHRDSRR